MANDCCKLVSQLDLGLTDVISVSVSSSTESSYIEGELVIGPTIGNITVSAFASEVVHCGCPGRASVSIPWIRKFDCDTGEVHFIFAGQGRSSIFGEVDGLASLNMSLGRTYPVLSASSSSGPTSLYTDGNQIDGYGLVYNGNPWAFTTSEESAVIIPNFGVGRGDLYLQSFNLDLAPGSLPIANFSFIFGFVE